MQHANKTRGAGPLGSSGLIARWGASSLVKSVQSGTMGSWTNATNTATISAVDTANTLVFHDGQTYDTAGNTYAQYPFVSLALTDSTTLTATKSAGGLGNTQLSWFVVEFLPGVIKSVQSGTVLTESTATVTAVNTAKSVLMNNGHRAYYFYDQAYSHSMIVLTNATTITCSRGAAYASHYHQYQLVEFF